LYTQFLRHRYDAMPLTTIYNNIVMEKICRYRKAQPITLEQFLENILDNPCCKYCTCHDECQEMMGLNNIEEDLGGYGCSAFDNSIENLALAYKEEYCK